MNKQHKITTKITHSIFEISKEGHLVTPSSDYYGREQSLFKGRYNSVADAEKDILENAEHQGIAYCGRYIVLPFIEIMEDITDQEL
jgi:hypothetical protein